MPQLSIPGIVPDQKAEVNPVNVPSIPVSPDAFGGAVGQAFSQFGSGLERDSNELWQRAVELQRQQNETEANNSLSGAMRDIGVEQEKFAAQEGLNAGPGAFEAHVKRMNDIRQKYRDGLTNPDAQRQFDGASIRYLGSEIRAAAGHSARQVRAANDAGLDARMQGHLNAISANPEDSASVRFHTQEAVKAGRAYWKGKGYDDATADEKSQAVTSKATGKRIEGLADKGKYDEAEKAANVAKGRGELVGDDVDNVDKRLRTSRLTTGARYAADGVLKDGIPNGESLESMQKRGDVIADRDFRGDVEYKLAVRSQIDTQFAAIQKAKRDKEQNARNIIDTARANGIPDDHIMADPTLRRAFEDLPGQEKFAIAQKAKHDFNDSNFTRIVGMLKSPDDDVKAEAMGYDLSKQPLNEPAKRALIAMRENILKHPQDEDPRARRAMGWFQSTYGPQMGALGIAKRSDNEDLYDRFMGTLSQAIEDLQKASGKPVGYKEWKDTIAPMMIETHTSQNWFQQHVSGGVSETTTRREIPEEHRKAIIEANTQAHQPPLDEERIRQLYNQRLLQKLYPPKSAAPQPGMSDAVSR